MRGLRTITGALVAFAIAVPVSGFAIHSAAAQTPTSVYVVAVGDIACDPSPPSGKTPDPYYYAAYNGGKGTKDGCRQKAVGDAVIAAKPDQFWALGDNQYYDGTYSKYMESYDQAFGPLKSITHPIPGNHEWRDLTIPTKPGAGYFTYFGDAAHQQTDGNYSFDAGDWHVVAINDNLCDLSHPCGPGSSMATWIASDIAANPKPCTAAMWHHPLWSLGEAHKGGYGPMAAVWNQLNGLGVDMVVTGHDHNYVRTVAVGNAVVDPADPSKVLPPTVDPKGMVEFVIGTGGVDNYAANAATAADLRKRAGRLPGRQALPGPLRCCWLPPDGRPLHVLIPPGSEQRAVHRYRGPHLPQGHERQPPGHRRRTRDGNADPDTQPVRLRRAVGPECELVSCEHHCQGRLEQRRDDRSERAGDDRRQRSHQLRRYLRRHDRVQRR